MDLLTSRVVATYGLLPGVATVGGVYALGALPFVPVSPGVVIVAMIHLTFLGAVVVMRPIKQREMDSMHDQWGATWFGAQGVDPQETAEAEQGTAMVGGTMTVWHRVFVYLATTTAVAVAAVLALVAL
jgi:hypothetical protein